MFPFCFLDFQMFITYIVRFSTFLRFFLDFLAGFSNINRITKTNIITQILNKISHVPDFITVVSATKLVE